VVRTIRRILALSAVAFVVSLAAGTAIGAAHPPTTRVFSVGMMNRSYTRMMMAFSCRAQALDAVLTRIRSCYTLSADGERHYAQPVSGPGLLATASGVANLPFLPYGLCVDAVSTHADGTTWNTGTRCYY
jgi:hypothetical protein